MKLITPLKFYESISFCLTTRMQGIRGDYLSNGKTQLKLIRWHNSYEPHDPFCKKRFYNRLILEKVWNTDSRRFIDYSRATYAYHCTNTFFI